MKSRTILVVSDSTGETAWRMTKSALLQFAGMDYTIHRIPEVRTPSDVEHALKIAEVKGAAAVLHTFADPQVRALFADGLNRRSLVGIDLIGPLLERLSDVLDESPQAVSGVQHRMGPAYDTRMAAIEYAVKHDDGLGRSTWKHAEVILVGPSRTGKTPLSMYLANEGYRVANVPFIAIEPMPDELVGLQGPLIVGLVTNSETLARVRTQQVRRLGADEKRSRYADPDEIAQELSAAGALYRRAGWPVVDVTNKAVEEVAVEIMALLVREGVQLQSG